MYTNSTVWKLRNSSMLSFQVNDYYGQPLVFSQWDNTKLSLIYPECVIKSEGGCVRIGLIWDLLRNNDWSSIRWPGGHQNWTHTFASIFICSTNSGTMDTTFSCPIPILLLGLSADTDTDLILSFLLFKLLIIHIVCIDELCLLLLLLFSVSLLTPESMASRETSSIWTVHAVTREWRAELARHYLA